MCTNVTHVAFRELCQHRRRMRRSMTGFARRNISVFIFVAEDTSQLGMFGVDAGQCVEYYLVAGSTILGRHILSECDRERLMGGMAGEAVFVHHFRRVWLMARRAFGHLSVRLVTGGAEEL